MLRPLVLALASGLLSVACALTEPLAPPGTIPVQLDVSNKSARPAELAVTSGGRVIPGAAQPPSLPPGGSADVVFHVPMASDWTITVNRQDLILRMDLKGRTGMIIDKGIEVDQQGNISWWCTRDC